MTPYFFLRYHAASHAQGYSRNAYMKASLTSTSVRHDSTVGATGWAE